MIAYQVVIIGTIEAYAAFCDKHCNDLYKKGDSYLYISSGIMLTISRDSRDSPECIVRVDEDGSVIMLTLYGQMYSGYCVAEKFLDAIVEKLVSHAKFAAVKAMRQEISVDTERFANLSETILMFIEKLSEIKLRIIAETGMLRTNILHFGITTRPDLLRDIEKLIREKTGFAVTVSGEYFCINYPLNRE